MVLAGRVAAYDECGLTACWPDARRFSSQLFFESIELFEIVEWMDHTKKKTHACVTAAGYAPAEQLQRFERPSGLIHRLPRSCGAGGGSLQGADVIHAE